jgi:phage tail-like protein
MATQPQPDQLVVQLEGKIVRVVALNMPVLTIGRTPENGLALADQTISRRHADLRMTEQGVTLTDLGSANGTFLGNERLLANQPHLLSEGNTFRVGPFFLTYRTVKTPPVVTDEQEELDSEEPSLPTDVIPAVLPEISPGESSQAMAPAPKPAVPVRRGRAEDGRLYLGFLPDIFQEDDFLRRFLHIFEDIWELLEHRQDHIEMYFDPRTCPASFLPWLASWLDLPFNPHWPEARHRRLLSAAMELYSWRGTAYGLTRVIEVCTGLTPLIRELPTQPYVFYVRIITPPGAAAGVVDKDFNEELIQTHKPAHAGYVLEVNT